YDTPYAGALSAKDGARNHEVIDSSRACVLEHPRELVQGRTSRDDIVQDGHARSGEVELVPERPAHVFRTILVRKFRLRRRVLHAQHAARLDRCAPVPREPAGDLERLIESALGEAFRVQRHRQDHVDLGQGPGREAAGEESRERELRTILERLHQPIARKFVAPQCERCVEVRGTIDAAPANRSGGTGERALRAGFGERRQFADTSRAEQLWPAFRAAEQAVSAGPGMYVSYAGVEQSGRRHLTTFRLARMIVPCGTPRRFPITDERALRCTATGPILPSRPGRAGPVPR